MLVPTSAQASAPSCSRGRDVARRDARCRDPATARAFIRLDHQCLPTRDRRRRDHRHDPCPARADDARQRRPLALRPPSRTGRRERCTAQPPAGRALTRPLSRLRQQAPRRRRVCCSEAGVSPGLLDLDQSNTLLGRGRECRVRSEAAGRLRRRHEAPVLPAQRAPSSAGPDSRCSSKGGARTATARRRGRTRDMASASDCARTLSVARSGVEGLSTASRATAPGWGIAAATVDVSGWGLPDIAVPALVAVAHRTLRVRSTRQAGGKAMATGTAKWFSKRQGV